LQLFHLWNRAATWAVESTDEFGDWWNALASADQDAIAAMTGHRPFSELTKDFSRARKSRITRKVAALKNEMTLNELRQARARSQKALAKQLKVGQPAVAKLERRADMYVSNLRRYVEALGGKLEITAKFPDAAVTIANFSDLAEAKGRSRKDEP
jgi:hypothetical protein